MLPRAFRVGSANTTRNNQGPRALSSSTMERHHSRMSLDQQQSNTWISASQFAYVSAAEMQRGSFGISAHAAHSLELGACSVRDYASRLVYFRLLFPRTKCTAASRMRCYPCGEIGVSYPSPIASFYRRVGWIQGPTER